MNPYVIIGAGVAFLVVATSAFFEGRHYEALTWEKAVAAQKIEAAAKLQTATAANAALDAKNSELAIRLDQEHANAIADAAASRDNFNSDLAKRLRETERRLRGRCTPAPEAAHPGVGADVAAVGDDGPAGVDLAAVRAVRDAALEMQAYAVACHGWAVEVGR